MGTYIGSKMIKARSMSRAEYNDYRGWELPADENGDDAGYLVECLGGGKPNHPNHGGYISWSPADVFDREYKPTWGMSLGMAVEALKLGKKVARYGWNGKDMFLFLVPGSTFKAPPLLGIYEEGTEINYLPHIDMKTATGEIVPWLASQADQLAEDWYIVR